VKNNIKKILLLFVTVIFLYFVFVNLDIKELLRVMKGFNLNYIFLLTLSMVISLSFRAICFKQLISLSAKPPLKELIPLCITGASLNIVLPARAGDIFRAIFIGQKYSVNKVKVFGTIMMERIFDIFVIFIFLFLGVSVYHRNEIAIHLCSFAGICMIIGALFAIIAYKYNKTDEICEFIVKKTSFLPFSGIIEKLTGFIKFSCNSFCNGFEIIDKPGKVFSALLASIGIWFFECLNFLIILNGYGYDIHWSVTIFIISFIALACMIPSTSIFIGPYQLAVISAFSIYNVNKEAALAISFTEQMIVTITTTIIAAIFLFKNNISFKELKEEIKKEA